MFRIHLIFLMLISWNIARGQESDTLVSLTNKKTDSTVNFGMWALTTGAWSPQGPNRTLGIHPFIGIMVGGWSNKFYYSFQLDARFLKAENYYTTTYEGSLVSTRDYFGGYLGVHAGYEFMTMESTSVYALGGIGYDGFDAVSPSYGHPDSKSINSINTNLGVGVMHFPGKGLLIGLEIQYSFLNYNNPGGTDLSGNALTFRLLIGGITRK